MTSFDPHLRARDPAPVSRAGETAFVVLTVVVAAVAAAALAGAGAAAALFGGGWAWPHGRLLSAVGGLLAGHPGRGYPPADATRLPGRRAVYAGVITAEAALLVVAVCAATVAARYWRFGDTRRGMATGAQARQVLGAGRLRECAPLIRPDQHRRRGGAR